MCHNPSLPRVESPLLAWMNQRIGFERGWLEGFLITRRK